MWNEGKKTFIAGEALITKRRVKIESGTVTDPPEVVYSDAGEDFIGITEYAVADGDPVEIRLKTSPGTMECELVIDSAIARGTILYGGVSGVMTDTSSGSAQAVSKEAPTADNSICEVLLYNVKSTTAGTVSYADAGAQVAAATVEALGAELATHMLSAQKCVPISLGSIVLEDGTTLTTFVNAAAALPGISQESDKEIVLRWNNHATPGEVALSIPMPMDLDVASDVVVHFLALMSGTTDHPEMTMQAFFGKADTDCAGTDDEVDGGTTLTEYICTILATDVPAHPTVLTLIMNPKDGELGTDDLLLYAVWLEYTGIILGS